MTTSIYKKLHQQKINSSFCYTEKIKIKNTQPKEICCISRNCIYLNAESKFRLELDVS